MLVVFNSLKTIVDSRNSLALIYYFMYLTSVVNFTATIHTHACLALLMPKSWKKHYQEGIPVAVARFL